VTGPRVGHGVPVPRTSAPPVPPRDRRPLLLILAGVVLLFGAGIVGIALVGRGQDGADNLAQGEATTPPPAPTTEAATVAPTTSAPRTFAATGPGTYVYAPADGPVVGTAGTLYRYRVAIETGTPVPIEEFRAGVENTLADPRSWIAGNNVRLQRVDGAATNANFTVYLVTPGTAQKLCGAGGYDIFWRGEPYTSCRVGARVLINIARYLRAVPNYGAPLEAYQQYAVNHEVGHALGHDHELCPGPGKPAPVMQQQTFDLQKCVAYSWPYLDGKRYAGPPGRIVPKD
jgi:hypothetical protein